MAAAQARPYARDRPSGRAYLHHNSRTMCLLSLLAPQIPHVCCCCSAASSAETHED